MSNHQFVFSSMIRRFSLFTSLSVLVIFILEIFFVYYLPDLYARSRVALVEYANVSGTVVPHAPLPSDRRKTAPEIRKYTQNTFRYTLALPDHSLPYIPQVSLRIIDSSIAGREDIFQKIDQWIDQRVWIRKISKHIQVIPESLVA